HVERFKREIQLARRVTHPNVCRIFDLGFHRGKEGDVTFLTMELLRGENLEDRLRRSGAIAVDEARPLAIQMADALSAAHRAGVGIVPYEMVTGVPPFTGRNALSAAVKRLREAPPSPRVHKPGLDPAWESLILRLLAREPEERFKSAAEVARKLRGEQVPAGRR